MPATEAAPRRRVTANPDLVPMAEAAPRPTRRRVGSPEQIIQANLHDIAGRIYAAKIAADQAAADYEAVRKEGLAAMTAHQREEFTIPADDERPAFQIKVATRANNTIDPEGLRKMLDEAEFMQCISVKVTEAKRFVGEARLEKITSTKQSAPFLDCRVKGKDRD